MTTTHKMSFGIRTVETQCIASLHGRAFQQRKIASLQSKTPSV